MPLSSAARWIVARATDSSDKNEAWHDAFAAMIPKIVSGRLPVYGRRSDDGASVIVPGADFAAIEIVPPDTIVPIKTILSNQQYLHSALDTIYHGRQGAKYEALCVEEAVVRRLWPSRRRAAPVDKKST